MTVYGEFDATQLPRPSVAAFAVVGLCQFVLAVWIASLSIALLDAHAVRAADVTGVVAAYPVPWGTLKGELARSLVERGASNDLALRLEREYGNVELPFAGGLLVLSLVLVYFWPARPTLARRMFLVTLGQVLALFGAALSLHRDSVTMLTRESAAPVAVAAAAIGLILAYEFRAIGVLASVVAMTTPLQRAGWWSLRILTGAAAVAALSWSAGHRPGWMAAVAIATATLFANLVHRPGPSFVRIEEPWMREAAAGLLFVVALLTAAAFAAFRPLGEHRAVIVEGTRVRLVATSALGAELTARWSPPAPPEQKIEIRWSKPRRTPRPGR
ncbi:MAG TPA: hypothetical protein VNL91_05605 [Thermoanaerobaculia bacterium]|nr:hypothetical protein [Thermoanaerobaculia bacterium]